MNEVTNVSVTEWVGFNYLRYKSAILSVLKKDKFTYLSANDSLEIKAGYLTKEQVEALRKVLKDGFVKEQSIREISKNILTDVNLKAALVTRDGKIVKNAEGDPVVALNAESRSIAIARSETVRISSEGSKKHFKDGGIKKYRWVASLGPRTCPVCEGLNGKLFDINSVILPPAHSLCRCTIVPVEEI